LVQAGIGVISYAGFFFIQKDKHVRDVLACKIQSLPPIGKLLAANIAIRNNKASTRFGVLALLVEV
jgi:hypothetical protein